MPKASQARIRANDKYNQKAYESIGLRVHKGTRALWRASAERLGMSLASMIQTAVAEYLERHPEPENAADADTL